MLLKFKNVMNIKIIEFYSLHLGFPWICLRFVRYRYVRYRLIFDRYRYLFLTIKNFVGLQDVFNVTLFRLPRRLEEVLESNNLLGRMVLNIQTVNW